jgi:pimeloyl-ACP methyl ester carboxylesterase
MNAAARINAASLVVIVAVLAEANGLIAQSDSQPPQTVQAGPARLQVTIKGRGEPIIFIPSRGRGVEDFEDLSTKFVQAGYQAILPEPRGIGGSAGPLEGITYHDLASDVAAVILGRGDIVETAGCVAHRARGPVSGGLSASS